MSKAVIVRVVLCEGTMFGDILCLYYASGRTHEYHGFESFPASAWEWCKSHTLVVDKPRGENGRYRRWE